MAITRNKLVPVIGVAALLIVGLILVFKWRGGAGHAQDAGKPVAQSTLPATKGADRDTPTETLKTVVANQKTLQDQVQRVLQDNQRLQQDLIRARQANPGFSPGAAGNPPNSPSPPVNPPAAASSYPSSGASGYARGSRLDGVTNAFGQALDRASGVFDTLSVPASASPSRNVRPSGAAPRGNAGHTASGAALDASDGQDAWRTIAPEGYAPVTSGGRGKPETVSYVRTSGPAPVASSSAPGAASQAARAAKGPIPYFTIPENSTLVGAKAMTSLIGRVPVNGRVTDPMQFKAVVGSDNLAANGFELPSDIAGMIVTGIAIGDMTLSCSEGRIRSVTFVFNDGSVRTVSSGHLNGSVSTGQTGSNNDMGFISDMHGNPCIQGKFVTNAPAYLTDIAAMKTLTAVGQAYAAAQTSVSQSAATGTTSAVTGNMSSYALGQAVAAGSDEVSKWLLERLKSSFDAVVTPAGQQLVLHLNKEIDIDKNPDGRKLVHRSQEPILNAGARYGLE